MPPPPPHHLIRVVGPHKVALRAGLPLVGPPEGVARVEVVAGVDDLPRVVRVGGGEGEKGGVVGEGLYGDEAPSSYSVAAEHGASGEEGNGFFVSDIKQDFCNK